MNDLVKVNVPSLTMTEQELITVLKNSLYPGAKDESVKLVISYCRAGGFDPMQKPVHIVPMSVKNGKQNQYGNDDYEMRDVIMPGVGLYRTLAARTEQYAGMSDPEFGPACTLKFADKVWEKGEKGANNRQVSRDAELKYPEWCKVTVRRLVHGHIVEFSAREYWLENYATAGKNTTAPNAMWKKRPYGQLAKCAEAQALRKGFPEAGAEATADEMTGKIIDSEGAVVEHERIAERVADSTVTASAPAAYSDDKFAENLPSWTHLIKTGKKTPSQIISTISSKGALSDEQKRIINEVKADSTEPVITYAQVATKLNLAKASDELATAADLIKDVQDEDQRKELADLYNKRLEELQS